MARAFDLTSINPSEFMEFRDSWLKEAGLESVGAERLFEHAGLSELVELDASELKEYAQEIGLNVIQRRRLIKAISKLNGADTSSASSSASTSSSDSVSNLDVTLYASPSTPTSSAQIDDGCSVFTFKPDLKVSTSNLSSTSNTNSINTSTSISTVNTSSTSTSTSSSAAFCRSNSSRKPKRKPSKEYDYDADKEIELRTTRSAHSVFPSSKKTRKASKDYEYEPELELESRARSVNHPKKRNKRKRSKSRGRKSASASPRHSRHCSKDNGEPDPNPTDDGPMYDPTGKTSAPSTPTVHSYEFNRSKDVKSRISDSIGSLTFDANVTKQEIRRAFMEFRQKLTEREIKLLHDVETTLDKKTRLLQTQLEYVSENNVPAGTGLACDTSMLLVISRKSILSTLMTAGWVQGASSDNKEEQALQDKERQRREYARQQYLTIERLKSIFIHEKQCHGKREETVRLTAEIQDEIALINIRTAKCETKLNAARPLLQAANKAVAKIGKPQLDEIRVMKSPPAVVELVMSSVAVTLGNTVNCWRDIQKCVLHPKFIPTVLNFDTLQMNKKRRAEVVKYIKHEDFNEERANKASKVAGPLVKWVKSQVKYSELLDVVRPMQKEIKLLRRKLDKKQKQLEMCIDHVNQLEMKITNARNEINEMVENMIQFQDQCGFDNDDHDDVEAKLHCFATIST